MVKMHSLFALMILSLSVTAVAAEAPFVVRADESPEDSIITIDVGAAPFMLERKGPRQIDLVTPVISRGFDVSALTSTGGARRVATARTVNDDDMNRLRLTLNCDCAYGFSISEGTLSITFRAAELEAEQKPGKTAQKGSRFAPSWAPKPFPRPAQQAANDATHSKVAHSGKDSVSLAREHLLEQLSRAAEQGLLEFSDKSENTDKPAEKISETTTENTSQAAAQAPSQNTDADDVASQPAAEEPNRPLRPKAPLETSLRARTAFDKYFRADRADTFVAVAPCIPADDLSLTGWPDYGDFVGQVAALRAALLDEFDQPQENIVRSLARVYILNGFGAEAVRLLNTFGTALDDGPLLTEMASIVEGYPLDPEGPIAASAPCHGSALLWRRIAGLPRAKATPSEAVWHEFTEAFSKLPRRLRELVAAPLLTSLVNAGEIAQADKLNLILSRAPVQPSASLDLARAKLLAAGGEAAAAEGLYERLAGRDSPESAESLLRLFDSRVARGAPISPMMADALSDLAFTARGQPLELAAKTAEIRARAATDGPAAALNAVTAAMERTPENAAVLRDAGHAALEQISAPEGQNAKFDTGYAEAVMAYQPWVSGGPDGDAARQQVGNELVSLGLPNAALAYLDPALPRGANATRIVAARALIALDRPKEALEYLADLDTETARTLRADALSRTGDFVAAAAADPSNTARALRAGNWEEAAKGEGPRAALATFMARPSDEANRQAPLEDLSLTGARAAQDAARATRALISEALNDG